MKTITVMVIISIKRRNRLGADRPIRTRRGRLIT
jgi:hypothetical protein